MLRGMGVKINLGSGLNPVTGFVNVDVLPDAPGVDVVADITERLPFDDGAADVLYASHILEHFSHADVPALLTDWRRVLRPGGQLLVAVPDLAVIASMLLEERRGWFTPPHNPWLGALYGGQKDDWDYHKGGFTDQWLAYTLAQADFGHMRRVRSFPEIGLQDSSSSWQPFGVNVSMNMRAVAGRDEPAFTELITPAGVERGFDTVDGLLHRAMAVSSDLRSRVMRRRQKRIDVILRRDQP